MDIWKALLGLPHTHNADGDDGSLSKYIVFSVTLKVTEKVSAIMRKEYG